MTFNGAQKINTSARGRYGISEFSQNAITNAISTRALRGSRTAICRVKHRIMGILFLLHTDSKENERITYTVMGVSKEEN